MNTDDNDKKTFNLRDAWRKRAAMDPDWAADQIYKGFQEDIRLQAEIKQLRAGIIEKGDDLIDQVQQWLLEYYRVELQATEPNTHGEVARFEARFYDALGRQVGWTTGSDYELRGALRWAMSSYLKTLEERDPELGELVKQQRASRKAALARKLEGS